MFLEVKKAPAVYVQNKDMDYNHLAPVTSNFRINLGLVGQLSTYTIKEDQRKYSINKEQIRLPVNTRVIHFEMNYVHSSRKSDDSRINERFYYKLYFLPEAMDEYVRLKHLLDRQTLR